MFNIFTNKKLISKITQLESEKKTLLNELNKHKEWGEPSYHADYLKAYGRNMAWLEVQNLKSHTVKEWILDIKLREPKAVKRIFILSGGFT